MSEVKRFYAGELSSYEYVIKAADFDRVTAERDALQVLLTAADERADVLLIMLRMAWVDTEVSAYNCRRIDAALKSAEGHGDE